MKESKMNNFKVFPDSSVVETGVVSKKFLNIGIDRFVDACRYVHELSYGYNSDRDNLMILFEENMGTCTTKHSVIATLAAELNLPIAKSIGIYAMTEEIVTGTKALLEKYDLPYLPMVHCFLKYEGYQVDLTEGNQNGKNRAIDDFLYTETVVPNISAKDEYLIYRKALKDSILIRAEMKNIEIKRILQAREEGLELLKFNIKKK